MRQIGSNFGHELYALMEPHSSNDLLLRDHPHMKSVKCSNVLLAPLYCHSRPTYQYSRLPLVYPPPPHNVDIICE